jgi:hypothetical protein
LLRQDRGHEREHGSLSGRPDPNRRVGERRVIARVQGD